MEQGSPNLQNRYRQYKTGTAKLLDWLATTAQASRDVSDVLPSQPSSAAASMKVRVSTAQMLQLAEIVVASSASIPEHILRTTKAVIAGRMLCSNMYAALRDTADPTVEEQNERHRYFIGVLTRIHSLLEQAKRSQALQAPASVQTEQQLDQIAGSRDECDSLRNMFSALQVEMPSDSALASTSLTGATSTKVTFELADDDEGKTFAFWCLVQDMYELRLECRIIWEKYRAANLSLNVAGFVADDACGLLRDAEVERGPDLMQAWTYAEVISQFNLRIENRGGQVYLTPDSHNADRPSCKEVTATFSLPEIFCPRAFVLLGLFRKALASAKSLGEDHPSAEHSSSNMALIHPFGEILHSLIPEFAAVSLERKGRVSQSRLLDYLQISADYSEHPVSTSQVISLQMMMDSFDVLKEKFMNPVERFKRQLLRDRRHFMGHKEYLAMNSHDMQGQECGQAFIEWMKIASLDQYFKARHHRSSQQNYALPAKYVPYRIHGAFPSLCGRMMHMSMICLQHIGHMACNEDYLVLSLAYLYHAALKAGAITKTWKDMEHVITAQSTEHDFVLHLVEGITGLPRCFLRSVGMLPSDFRSNRPPPLSKVKASREQRAGARLQSHCPIWGSILHLARTGGDNCRSIHSAMPLPSISTLRKFIPESDPLNSAFKQYERTGRLTPAQHLSCETAVLSASNQDLKFNYTAFAASCSELMKEIHAAIAPSLSLLFNGIHSQPGFNEASRCEPPYAVTYAVLLDAEFSLRKNNRLKGSLLWRVADLMNAYIEGKGEVCSTMLQQKMEEDLGTKSQDSRPSQASRNIRDEDVMSIRQLIGLPTADSDQIGCFCGSEEEMETRAQIANAWLGTTTSTEDHPVPELNVVVTRILELSLQRMTREENKQVQVKLARCIGEDDNMAWDGVKNFLALAKLTPEKLFDILLTHS